MSEWKVPVQSLIDHIKTAVDVDQWAKDMAEELLKEQDAVEPKVIGENGFGHPVHACGKCGHLITESMNYCSWCGCKVGEWND